jgi:hypothetical protein
MTAIASSRKSTARHRRCEISAETR